MNRPMLAAAMAAALWINGCAVRPPELDRSAEAAAAGATGLAEPIAFRVAGVSEEEAARMLASDEPLTPGAAVRQALLTDPTLQAALAEVRIAQAEAWQARLLPNPVLSVVLRFPEHGGQPVVEAGVAAELLSVLRMPGRVKTADARLRAAAARAVTAALDAAAGVAENYAEAQALDAAIAYLQHRRRLIDRVVVLERSRFEGGETTRLELVTLQMQRVELETELDDLLLQRTQARLALASRLGVPRSDLVWRLAEWEAPPYAGVSEEPWIDAALEHRPELQALLYELEALGVEADLARSWLLGEIEIGVEAEHADSMWEVGPGLSTPIPIFDWGQAGRAEARARLVRATHELLAAKRLVIEEVRQAAAAFNDSVHRLSRVRDALIPLAEERAELAEQGLAVGQNDAVTLLLAEQDLTQARQRVVELERRTAEALARLHRAAGGSGLAAELVARTPEAVSHEPRSTHDHHDTSEHSNSEAPAAPAGAERQGKP